MTDAERAEDIRSRLYDMTADEMAAEFAAVRLEERAAVVAYLKQMAEHNSVAGGPIRFLSLKIDHGAHLDAGGRAGSAS